MKVELSDSDSWWHCDERSVLPRAFNESFAYAEGSSSREAHRINVIEIAIGGGHRLLVTSGMASAELPDLIFRATNRQANSTVTKVLETACRTLAEKRNSSCTQVFKVGAKSYRLNPVSLSKRDLDAAANGSKVSDLIFTSMLCAERAPILLEILTVNAAGESESVLGPQSSSLPAHVRQGSAHSAFAHVTALWSNELDEFRNFRNSILASLGDAVHDLGIGDDEDEDEDETTHFSLAHQQEELLLGMYDEIESEHHNRSEYASVFEIEGFGSVNCHSFVLDLDDVGTYAGERTEETTLLCKLVFAMHDGTRIAELRCRIMSFMDEEEEGELNPYAYSFSDRDWLSAIFNPDCTLRKETVQAWEQMPDLFSLLDKIWIAPVFRTVETLAHIVTIGSSFSSFYHPFLPQQEVRVGVCLRILDKGEEDSPAATAWYNSAVIEHLLSVMCRPVAHMFPFNNKPCNEEHPRVYALTVFQDPGS